MGLVHDQNVVEDLPADGADHSLAVGVHGRSLGRAEQHVDLLGGEDSVEGVGVLAVAVAAEEAEDSTRLPRSLATLRACRGAVRGLSVAMPSELRPGGVVGPEELGHGWVAAGHGERRPPAAGAAASAAHRGSRTRCHRRPGSRSESCPRSEFAVIICAYGPRVLGGSGFVDTTPTAPV